MSSLSHENALLEGAADHEVLEIRSDQVEQTKKDFYGDGGKV
jgi:hypothetical protein